MPARPRVLRTARRPRRVDASVGRLDRGHIGYLGVDKYGILTAAVVFSGVCSTHSPTSDSGPSRSAAAAGRDSVEHVVGLNLGVSMIYAAPLWRVTTVAGLPV